MASGPVTSWEIDGETVETVSDFIFFVSKITADGDCSHEIPDDQAGLERAEEPEIKLPTSAGSWKKQESSRIYFCFIDYAKAFDCVDQNRLWKILQEMGILDYHTFLLCNLYAGHPAYLTYMQSTSCEMPG